MRKLMICDLRLLTAFDLSFTVKLQFESRKGEVVCN